MNQAKGSKDAKFRNLVPTFFLPSSYILMIYKNELQGNSSGEAAIVLSCSVRSLKPAGKSTQIDEEPKKEQKSPATNQDLTKPEQESQPNKETTAASATEPTQDSEGPSSVLAESQGLSISSLMQF